jgi:hypothetical protein
MTEDQTAPTLAELRDSIRRDALEEAATLCESMSDCSPRQIAECIRELADK